MAARFAIKDVAAELRDIIFTYSLYLAHDQKCPDLLVALAKEPQLYEEARQIYHVVNAKMTIDNEKAFRRTSLVKLRRVKHLTVVLPLLFQAQLITMVNKLRSLAIDTTGASDTSLDTSGDSPGFIADLRNDAVSVLELLLPASKDLHILTIKLKGKNAEGEIADVTMGLGFEPAREVLDDGALICTWDTSNGQPLFVAGKVWHRVVKQAELAAKMAAVSL